MQHSHPTESRALAIKNGYEARSVFRTITGVVSALLFMGVPIGVTEFLRAGGDKGVAAICAFATLIAAGLAVLSIRGTLED
ncbi:MAG TPA: hypothetical protein VGB55_12130 [Tepidisphaeraceae bacterium]|jgi:hypothetical protein